MIVAYIHTHTHLMVIGFNTLCRWNEDKGTLLLSTRFSHYLKWELVETTDIAHIFIISTLPRALY